MSIFDTKGNIHVESIQDPKTGETIHRVAIDQKHIEDINKTINEHSQTMNAFVINSQQFFMGLKVQLELLDKIKVADDAIKKTLNEVTKKTKLDQKKPWVFNMVLKCFEYRTAPVAPGMSPSELSGYKPEIIHNPGIGVK